jgi:hypothetical protein
VLSVVGAARRAVWSIAAKWAGRLLNERSMTAATAAVRAPESHELKQFGSAPCVSAVASVSPAVSKYAETVSSSGLRNSRGIRDTNSGIRTSINFQSSNC